MSEQKRYKESTSVHSVECGAPKVISSKINQNLRIFRQHFGTSFSRPTIVPIFQM